MFRMEAIWDKKKEWGRESLVHAHLQKLKEDKEIAKVSDNYIQDSLVLR